MATSRHFRVAISSRQKKDAETFAELVEAGGALEEKVETVADACERYAKRNPEAEGRFKRHIYSDPVGKLKLAKLRRRRLQEWRKRLEDKPALVSRRKRGAQMTRPRAGSSVNRDMAMLRAALNRILAPGAPDTEAAWQEALRPIRNADRQRALYLDRGQRQILLANMEAETEPFVRALCLLPLRPWKVANLSVTDFDKRTSELSVGKDKSGKSRRILVPSAVVELFLHRLKARVLLLDFLCAPTARSGTGTLGRGRSRRLPQRASFLRASRLHTATQHHYRFGRRCPPPFDHRADQRH